MTTQPPNSSGEQPPHTSLLVRAAADNGSRNELINLCAPPMFAYFLERVRGRPNSREDAIELMHAFLLHFFMEPQENRAGPRFTRYLDSPPSGRKGSFIGYLIVAAENFYRDVHRRARAAKRDGSKTRLSIDTVPDKYEPLLTAQPGLTPEERAHLTFDLDLLWRAFEATVRELSSCSDRPLDRDLQPYLGSGPPSDRQLIQLAKKHRLKDSDKVLRRWQGLSADRELIEYLADDSPPPYAELAGQLKTTVNYLQVRFCRMRAEVESKIATILKDFEVAEPRKAAAEVVRRLSTLKRLREKPEDLL